MRKVFLNSFDGTKLCCFLWDDVENAKGVVQISHGMSEHARRYDRFARFLNERGYIVFGDDHRGHGLTASDFDRGNHKGNMFWDTVKDLVFIHNHLKETYNLPLLFVGHSYGSFLGQSFLTQNTETLGVALAGTAYMPRWLVRAGIIFTFPLYLFARKWRPKFVNKSPDALTRRRFKESGASIWISRDPDIRQNFIDDSLSGVDMSVNFDFCLMRGIYNTWKKKSSANLKKDIPIGLFCGSMDIIGCYGKWVPKLRDNYKKLGVKKVEMHIYPDDRHEVLNELDYETVQEDMVNFLDSCLIKA